VTYKEFLNLAQQEAIAGQNSITSPILDIGFTAEVLVPEVWQAVVMSYAADPQKASLLSRDHTITLTNGVGDLPEEVLTLCKFNSTAYDPDDDVVGPTVSLVRTWNDFTSPSSLDRLTTRYTLKDQQIFWVEQGESYSSTDGKDGDVVLNIPSVPEIPATEDTEIDAASEFLSDAITSLAQRLRGVMEKAA